MWTERLRAPVSRFDNDLAKKLNLEQVEEDFTVLADSHDSTSTLVGNIAVCVSVLVQLCKKLILKSGGM